MIKKRFLLFLVFILGTSVILKSQILNQAIKLVQPASQGFTEKDAVSGMKEALVKGTGTSVSFVSKLDGYFRNPEIKIPFPGNAKMIESKLRSIGLGSQADDVILSINRAAEDAAKEAEPIFVSAIREMSITDAIQLVTGKNDACTQYLSRTTTPQLKEKFSPIIKASLDKVNATRYWEDAVKTYNHIPFVSKQNPNLTEYVTEKAIRGLFIMIAKEELKIRQNPAERTTEILKKVFGK